MAEDTIGRGSKRYKVVLKPDRVTVIVRADSYAKQDTRYNFFDENVEPKEIIASFEQGEVVYVAEVEDDDS